MATSVRLALGGVLHTGRLAFQIAQVVELRPADLGRPHHLDLLNRRRVQRKNALDTLPEGDLPDREGGARAAAMQADDDALEDLNAFLVALAYLHMHADGIARFHRRTVGQLRLFNDFHGAHCHAPSFSPLRYLCDFATSSRRISCSSSSSDASFSSSGRRASVRVSDSRFRQRRISAWLPDSNTSGPLTRSSAARPPISAGRVYCGKSSRPRLNESAATDCSSPTTPGMNRATTSMMTSAASSPPLST